jgi:hypothetical protein
VRPPVGDRADVVVVVVGDCIANLGTGEAYFNFQGNSHLDENRR